MCVTETELFHGAVLAKIMRGKPDALRLVERDSVERAVYLVEGLPGTPEPSSFYVKYSCTPQRRRDGSAVWAFTFSAAHLRQIREAQERGRTFLTLVCGNRNIKDKHLAMELAVVWPDEIDMVLDTASIEGASIRVEKGAGRRRLRVHGRASEPLLVKKARMEQLVGTA